MKKHFFGSAFFNDVCFANGVTSNDAAEADDVVLTGNVFYVGAVWSICFLQDFIFP